MTEERILSLIDKAVDFRKARNDGESTFITLRLKIGHQYRDFSAIKTMRYVQDGDIDDLVATLFKMSLRQCYISNVRPISVNTIQVNLKWGTHGRDTNFGADTIDKLVSSLRGS